MTLLPFGFGAGHKLLGANEKSLSILNAFIESGANCEPNLSFIVITGPVTAPSAGGGTTSIGAVGDAPIEQPAIGSASNSAAMGAIFDNAIPP